ncbi:MAG: Arginase [Halothiobacillaceae bacterium]|nr:MAG: Arginase [Halothiobacillaceae bacterium]
MAYETEKQRPTPLLAPTNELQQQDNTMNKLQYQYLPNAPLNEADVIIFPVPMEATVSFKGGTAEGPEAIMATTDQLEYYEEDGQWCPFLHMRVAVIDAFVTQIEGESEAAMHQRLFEETNKLPHTNLLIALGGEHSITPAIVQARMPTPGTIVHLDAHADIRETFHGSEYNHACPMHRLAKQGHKILSAGIRSVYEGEAERIKNDPNVTMFMDRQLYRPAEWQRYMDTLKSLTGPVFLTIDMDAFDPALVSGVGTPQPGGLSWHQTLDIVEALLYNPNIELRGADIVELAPEASCVSAMTAAKLMQKIISHWGKSKGYDQRPQAGSQAGMGDL